MSGSVIQSGYCLFNCGVSAVPNFSPVRSQLSTKHVVFMVRLILREVWNVNKD